MKKLIKLLAILCCAVMMFTVMGGCFNPSNSSSGDGSSSGSSAETPASSDAPASSEEPGPGEEPGKEDKTELYSYRPQITEVMPAVRINTPTDSDNTWATAYNRNDKLQDRIDYVDATITVNNCEEDYKLTDVEAEVKVRGNYTLDYSKKPIRIKFGKKNNMLGLHGGEKIQKLGIARRLERFIHEQ
ncbi:MAG: hypothetical protein IKC91_04780 [Clostridia bacterium]|nr:hypothetical protein [Clostridia bacterium]